MNMFELSDDSVRLYIIYQRHFDRLERLGFFDVKNGKATVFFNGNGDVMGVEKVNHWHDLTSKDEVV